MYGLCIAERLTVGSISAPESKGASLFALVVSTVTRYHSLTAGTVRWHFISQGNVSQSSILTASEWGMLAYTEGTEDYSANNRGTCRGPTGQKRRTSSTTGTL